MDMYGRLVPEAKKRIETKVRESCRKREFRTPDCDANRGDGIPRQDGICPMADDLAKRLESE